MYADDNRDELVAAMNGVAGRPNWFTGNLDFNPVNPSNWDITVDMIHSPLWLLVGQNKNIFKCPADKSEIIVNGATYQRVRSISMSQVFGTGEWLDGPPLNAGQKVWRTYNKISVVAYPSKTFVYVDEHPDSINDGAIAVPMKGNQGTDPPSAAFVIDVPAAYHNHACGFSFADGHAEIHKWRGQKIQPPVTYTGVLTLGFPAGDSWVDMHWWADNTTVHD
jgi:prepilin-type processing-associated H-X9-DG protein